MQLTQRAAWTDVKRRINDDTILTEEVEPYLNLAFNYLYVYFDRYDIYFDDTDSKLQALQEEAEVELAAFYFYTARLNHDTEAEYSGYYTEQPISVSFGSVAIRQQKGSKEELLKWYRVQAQDAKTNAQKIIALLSSQNVNKKERQFG